MVLMIREHNIENPIFSFSHRKMSAFLKHFNGTKFQVSELILMEFPSIHSWQHGLSLPLALLYVSAIGTNVLILITIYQDPSLKQPTYIYFPRHPSCGGHGLCHHHRAKDPGHLLV